MANFKKISAAAAALAMMGSLAACGSNSAYALTIDGEQVNAGIYIYYSYVAYNDAITTLTEQNSELDTTDDELVKEQIIDGKDVLTWIQDEAVNYCQEHVAINKKFEEEGLELSAEAEASVDEYVEYVWSSQSEAYEKNGISESSVNAIMEYTYKASELFLHFYEIDGVEGVTEEEVHDYYVENNARVQYVKFDLVDGAGEELEGDGLKDMEEMTEKYLAAVEKLDKEEDIREEMDSVKEEYSAYVTSVSNEALATATDAEGNTVTTTTTTTTEATTVEGETTTTTTTVPYANESLIARITTDEETKEEDVTYTPSKVVHDFIFDEAELNVPAIVEDEEANAKYLIVRYDIEERMTEDDLWTEEVQNNVVSAMFSDAFQEKLDAWCEEQKVDVNDAAVKRYDPFAIDFSETQE